MKTPWQVRKSARIRPRIRRQRRRRLARQRRIAPGAGIAAGDQPVDDAGDDARAGHDLQMPPHDAFELQRVGMKRDQAKIAGKPHDASAHGIGERAADVERLGDRDDHRRRHQREAGDEDEAEPEQDIDRALIDGTGAEIGELRKQQRDDNDHAADETGGEEADEDDDEAADQGHDGNELVTDGVDTSTIVMPGLDPGIHDLLSRGSTWVAGATPAMTGVESVAIININPSSPWPAASGVHGPRAFPSPT